MVRHKKGYTTVAIIIVAVLFFIAAAIYQTSKGQSIAYHQPSVQISANPGGHADSSSKKISPVPTSPVSPAHAPTFSAPTIFSPSTMPTPTVEPTEFKKP
jgi:hypothetical protein